MINGYSITREYRLLTVYAFNDALVLLSIKRFKPKPSLDRVRRWMLFCQELRRYKIPAPQYFPPAEKRQPRSSEHARVRWLAEHLDEFPLGDISSGKRQALIERMKQAGLFAPSTYWKDAWRSVSKMLIEVRKEQKASELKPS